MLSCISSILNGSYPTLETRVLQLALEGAHLALELLERTVVLRRLKVHQHHVMPLPYEKVVLVDIPMLDSQLVQPPQRLLAALGVSRPRGPRSLHPLHDEANHAPVFALGNMAEKLGADAAAIEGLVGSRLNIDRGEFPRPDGKFDEYGLAVVEVGMC